MAYVFRRLSPLARDGPLFGRGVIVRLRFRRFRGRIPRKAQEHPRHVYEYRAVLERDESTRSTRLPLEVQTSAPRLPLAYCSRRKSHCLKTPLLPIDSTRHEQVDKATSIFPQCSPYQHCVLMCLLLSRYCGHDTLYTAVQYCPLPPLVSISSTWYTLWPVRTI